MALRLFNDAFLAERISINDELERMRNEANITYFNVSQHSMVSRYSILTIFRVCVRWSSLSHLRRFYFVTLCCFTWAQLTPDPRDVSDNIRVDAGVFGFQTDTT